MQPSKLHLENYFVEKASFQIRKGAMRDFKDQPRLNTDDLTIKVALGTRLEKPNKRFCQLSIGPKPTIADIFPYEFHVIIVGFFELSEESSEVEKKLLMTNTAPSILFSAAREYLLLITGRSLSWPLLLPTVTFTPTKQEATQTAGSRSRKVKTDAKPAKGKTASKVRQRT